MAVATCCKPCQSLPVQQRKEFKNDPAFAETRESVKREGSSIVEKILNSDKNTIDSMDQAFFHDDRFEIIIDARGYAPQDIQCVVTQENIEIKASAKTKEGNKERSTTMTRSYQLPKNILPERGNCNLSADGILVLSVPWKI